MKRLGKVFLISAGFLLTFGVCFSVWQFTAAQTKPLTYPEIITALGSTIPNKSFKTKTELINFLIGQIKSRRVDKPLTKDREDDLRQAGATDELIAAIKENSPPIPTPTPPPTPTPTPTPPPTPVPTPTPTPKPMPIVSADGRQMKNLVGIEFVRVSRGEFMMGSNKVENEKPAHKVVITNGFWLGRYEISIGEWKAVMGDIPPDMKRIDAKFSESDRQPVIYVSWDDAQEFITKLNAANDGFLYRLPTEAEWEYAARAGTTTEFAFGNDLSSIQANFDGRFPFGNAAKGTFLEKTATVGSYQTNAWGLYDMHGNVLEWCQDWYDAGYYAKSPTNDPTGSVSGTMRIVRGGAWFYAANYQRSAFRRSNLPTFRGNVIGFRLVAAAK